MNKMYIVLIVVGLGLIAFILWKSGLFNTLKTATDAADKAATDVADLPQNLVTGAVDVTQLPKAIEENIIYSGVTQSSEFNNAIQGKATEKESQLTVTMQRAVYQRYGSSVNATNWSWIALANGAQFDSNGNIIGDRTVEFGIAPITAVTSMSQALALVKEYTAPTALAVPAQQTQADITSQQNEIEYLMG